MFKIRSQSYAKELPGTDCVFQPDDLDAYSEDPWDIRISISGAPLEDAFYFTVDDPAAASKPIRALLSEYALNPAKRELLAVDDYPDLPYLQEELLQYEKNAKEGLLDVSYYVNHAPDPGPVDLNSRASNYLSSCAYHDGSHDYLVLDLVLVASVVGKRDYDAERMVRDLSDVFLMKLIDYRMQHGDPSLTEFMTEPPVSFFLGNSSASQYINVSTGLRHLVTSGFIKRAYADSAYTLEVSEAGLKAIADLNAESQDLSLRYDLFDSVGIAPPALGVPDGFDARVQMMEFDGLKCERSVLLRVIDMAPDLYFLGDWGDAYEDASFLTTLFEALAYKTNFSREVLESLKQLAESET
jgi:hypothetical protein